LLVGTVAVAVAVTVLGTAVGIDPRPYTLVFGVIAMVAVFALPPRHRVVLVGSTVVGWALALPLAGVRDLAVIVTQIGGAALLAVVALTTTRTLEAATTVEREAAAAAGQRSALLTGVLRLRSLEPDAVLDAVIGGTRAVGLDSAVVGVPEAGGLRLAANGAAPGEDPPAWLPPGTGIGATVLATGRSTVLESDPPSPATGGSAPSPLRGAIAVPVTVGDDHVAAVLIARRTAPGVTAAQQTTLELLAEEAGAALERARRFAADAATVAELRRLDTLARDFVSTVSHELRTPMTVVAGLAQTLQRRWSDLEPARRGDLLQRIDSNAERLATMVRSLIDTSALERGELRAVPAPVAVLGVIEGVLGRLESLFDDHHVVTDVADSLVVQADPGLFPHVIENLMTNAARHTPPGTHVLVTGRAAGSDIEFSVTDDGPGIAPVDLPHVLERFYRAGPSTARPAGGLGLGLALTQQILAAHGREIAVWSQPGRGTSFTFTLPAAPPSDRC
jgi:signal transduction histidine kinase